MHPSIPTAGAIDPEIEHVVALHGGRPESLLAVLRSLQSKCRELDRQTMADIACVLKIPVHRVEEVATFYSLLSKFPHAGPTLRVCDGIVCWMAGAVECLKSLQATVDRNPALVVIRTSCLGLCDRAPAALIHDRQCGPLSPNTASESFRASDGTNPAYAKPVAGEHRVMLARAGRINPQSIDDALREGAYGGLAMALSRTPDFVISEIERSGLRGRGGAGFPTGRKWRSVADSDDAKRYVVCNADESEPLMFKDRVLLETDPHAVIEGVALAAYAVGASDGFIYIRGEYEPQARLLEEAIRQATESSWLGRRIAGSEFSFRLTVHRGAGAYICGEETALLESLEGKRGEPRVRPPYPAKRGYHGHPTVVNNVETLAACAAIISRGADWYRSLGLPGCPGTRLFTLSGHLRQPGLVEVPFGFTLREMIETFGGGMLDGRTIKLVLTGGAAGSIVGARHLDVPLDYDSQKHGVAMGSGGILVCDESVSAVALVRELMRFFELESCGKCTPCRIGTSAVRQILDDLLSNAGTAADLNQLRELSQSLKAASFCGLGRSASDPLSSALANFGSEFEKLVSMR